MTTDELLHTLMVEALGPEPTDEDALAAMILFHTSHLWFKDVVLSDGIAHLCALTRRHVAALVAECWPDRSDRSRTHAEHWYFEFNTRTPFEVVTDVEAV